MLPYAFDVYSDAQPCAQPDGLVRSFYLASVGAARRLARTLESDGWFLVRTKGSHRQYHHPGKPGTVTVSGKSSVEVPIGTLMSVLRQAGLKK